MIFLLILTNLRYLNNIPPQKQKLLANLNVLDFCNKYSNIEISKVFYILDLTDVHDESNRWNDITGLDFPIIVDKTTRKEIKKTFSYENKFRVSRFVAYHLNNYLRNFKKKIKKLYEDKEEIDIDLKGTYWGSFTHTDQNKLFKDPVYKKMWGNDYQVGLKKIKVKIKDISNLLKSRNIDFYITIHPWRETLELGQKKFNWENYANELCDISDCTKVINLFDTIRDVKKIILIGKIYYISSMICILMKRVTLFMQKRFIMKH